MTEAITPEIPGPSDHIIPRVIEEEMKEAYVNYAMSVIVGRALPDIRDGLKPVHRRILYAMSELGMFHTKPFKKCARIVGEVLGKFHPHGDVAVYDSLVRMAQDFSLRYPLIKGQGNFGSVDGDNPAAMRYTEAKLNKLAEEILKDIEKNTVDFRDNFDGSLKEPVILPSKLPQLLINGSSGIAVGMATNIPPHNIMEVCNATIALIENPSLSTEELFLRIPADAVTGEYDVHVTVEYSRGHEVLAAKTKVFVEGAGAVGGSDGAVVVNVDASAKPVTQGNEVAYKVLVANMGDDAKTFTVSVAGERIWATSRVEPSTVFVPADSTEEAYIYLMTKPGASTGKQLFTVKVLDGTEVVAEKDLVADIAAKEKSAGIGDSFGSTKKALIIGFGVLVVLLVILGLIIAFNRMNDDDDNGEIPTSEGQAYY